jgi:hypothetical protein
MTMHNILVATDLTDASEMALERTLAFSSGRHVTLLHARDCLIRCDCNCTVRSKHISLTGRCIRREPAPIQLFHCLPQGAHSQRL